MWWQWPDSVHNTSHTTHSMINISPKYLYFFSMASQCLAMPMCQVADCALCVMCTTHVHNPGPWPSVWQGHWGLQAVGASEFGYRGQGGGWAPPKPGLGHQWGTQLPPPVACQLWWASWGHGGIGLWPQVPTPAHCGPMPQPSLTPQLWRKKKLYSSV